MSKVWLIIDNVVTGFLNWIYSLPPDSVKEYEIALAAYLVTLHLINPSDQAVWVAAGFAVYGIIKAVRDVSNASVTRATIKAAVANLNT